MLGVTAGGQQVQSWAPDTSTLTGHLLAGADATYDQGAVASGRFRDYYASRTVYAGTSVLIGGTAPAGATSLASLQSFGTGWALIGGSSVTNAANKTTGIGGLHYLAAEKPLTMMVGFSTSTASTVYVGGGVSSGHAATDLIFVTSATTTGGAGTGRWGITSAGALYPVADAAYDFGAASAQARDAYLSRRLLIGGAAPAGAASLGAVQAFGSTFALIGAHTNLTDATDKAVRIAGLHYLAAEEPIMLVYGYGSVGGNTVAIGGGSSVANAATEIQFWTAPNNTTVTGTGRYYISSSGHFAPFSDNTYDAGLAAARIRSGYFGTNVVIGYSTTSAAQLHVGAGATTAAPNGAGGNVIPQVVNSQTSGVASTGVGVFDGTFNRRASFFVNHTGGVWGLGLGYSSTPLPFVVFNAGAVQFQLSTSAVATFYGNVLRGTDNTYDDGALDANRVRSYYAGTSFIAPLGAVGTPSFTFTGDSNTGMWSPAADTLAWSTGGIEGARLNSSQNFGIGTTNPSRRLSVVGTDVNGNFADFKNASDAVLAVGSTANGGRVQAYLNAYAGVAALILNGDGGNVGIGINPSTKFHVAGVTTLGGNALFSSDNTYDFGAAAASRIRSGYFGTNVVIGYSTTSTAQLHVGAGADLDIYNGALGSLSPQIINSQTSGAAAIGAAVYDGTFNRRVGLFVDNTNSIWGLSLKYSSITIPFVIIQSGTEQFRLSTAGVATLYNNLLFSSDAAYDVGGAAANRPRDLNVSRNVTAGSTIQGSLVNTTGGYYSWNSDTFLYREAANVVALRNGGSAQTFRLYNTTDGGANYARFTTTFSSNDVYLLAEQAGTGPLAHVHLGAGTGKELRFLTGGTTRWLLDASSLRPSADATYDLGATSAQVRDLYLSRRLLIGGAAPAGAAGLATIQAFGNTWAVIGGNPLTDATTKVTAFGSLHYTNAEEPSTVFCTSIGSAFAALNIGGGTASGNAMMRLNFYTAANNTTTTGTPRWQIDEFGVLFPVTDAATDIGYSTQQIRDLYLSRSLKIGGAAPAGAANTSAIQAFGNSFALIGGDVLTDATTKASRIGVLHYLAAEEPSALIYGYNTVAGNDVLIGGGSSSMNAATQVSIYTAANNTTTTGTQRWYWNSSGHFLAVADNTYSIGADGAYRPANLHLANRLYLSSYVIVSAVADGIALLRNNAATGLTGIKLGGTSNAFPYIKVYGANIGIRKADDSGYAELYAAAVETTSRVLAQTAQAMTAGGGALAYGLTSTSGFGIYAGSGAPTLTAAKGSLYLRSDGSTTNDRMYVNTDGATTWTAVITAT